MSTARGRGRSLARAGSSGAFLLMLMFVGSLGMWLGLPLLWLWIGGRVQGATGSLGAAVGLVLFGFVASVITFVPVLGWLARRHAHAREARGLEDLGRAPLEGVMVVSATITVVVFVIWFFVFAGAEPLPAGPTR